MVKEKDKNHKDAKDITREILDELKQDLVDAVWKEFELKLTNTHDQFFSNLLRDFPDLNSSELKICALIRLNMSSKEIAAHMHQTPPSIDVARSRLRKKLNLDKEESLLIRLMKY